MLLMNHAISARSHTFAIRELEDLKSAEENVVGVGICTLHSLINHSCDPNVRFFTRNREHVLYATRPIKKAEQVRGNIGCDYALDAAVLILTY